MKPVFKRAYLGLLAAGLVLMAAPAIGAESLETAIKANYLYKFAPFVEWPESAWGPSPFTICIVGADPFGPVLDQAVKGQRIGPRSIEIKRLKIAEANSGCHIMYLGGSQEQSVAQGLDAVHGTPVLSVTSDNVPGAVIHFVLENNHVRFDIDDVMAADNKLSISSKLLSLARSVKLRKP